MIKTFRCFALAGCAALAFAAASQDADAQGIRRYSDDSRNYWNGYWGWYDGYYRPYYQRRNDGWDSYGYRDNYGYRRYPYSDSYDPRYPQYRAYRPGGGVRIGPFGFQYWY